MKFASYPLSLVAAICVSSGWGVQLDITEYNNTVGWGRQQKIQKLHTERYRPGVLISTTNGHPFLAEIRMAAILIFWGKRPVLEEGGAGAMPKKRFRR